MTSATFTVNGSSAQIAHVVTYGSTSTLTLVNTSGIDKVDWSIVGVSHAATTTPTITGSGKRTAVTITWPSTPGVDWSWLVEAVANDGRGPDGKVDANLTCRRVIGTRTYGTIVPVCRNESLERDAIAGWASTINQTAAASVPGVQPAVTVASIRANATLPTITQSAWLDAHTTPGYGAGPLVWDAASEEADDGGTIFKPTAITTGRWKRPRGPKVMVTDFGALPGAANATANTAACQAAIDYLGDQDGGTLVFPEGEWYLVASETTHVCLWVNFGGLRIEGRGKNSVLRITENDAIPLHISTESDVTQAPSGTVDGFEIENIRIEGTGVYQYAGLAQGRGILMRGVSSGAVRHCHVNNMSMIGICVEHGIGPFDLSSNRLHGNKFTGININARGYSSTVCRNLITATGGDTPNSSAIEVIGQCIVAQNVIYGNQANPTNYGGLLWGEGNFDGQAEFVDNVVTWCRYGFFGIYHGACSVRGNLIMCCYSGGGGIITSAAEDPLYDVFCSHILIAGNRVVNCAPTHIVVGTPNTVVSGNICRHIADPVNPSAPTEPDAIFPGATIPAEIGIEVRSSDVTVTSNHLDGMTSGISIYQSVTAGALGHNTFANCTRNYQLSDDVGAVAIGLTSREQVGSVYVDILHGTSLPAVGKHPLGSRWHGTSKDAAVILSAQTTVDTQINAGETTLVVDTAVGITRNTVLGVVLDNSAIHWSLITAKSGTSLTLATAIPASRHADVGAAVYVTGWSLSALGVQHNLTLEDSVGSLGLAGSPGVPSGLPHLTEDTGTSVHYAQFPVPLSDPERMVLCRVVAEAVGRNCITIGDTVTSTGSAFNLSTGTVVAAYGGAWAEIDETDSGIWQCDTYGSWGSAQLGLYLTPDGTTLTYLGDASSVHIHSVSFYML